MKGTHQGTVGWPQEQDIRMHWGLHTLASEAPWDIARSREIWGTLWELPNHWIWIVSVPVYLKAYGRGLHWVKMGKLSLMSSSLISTVAVPDSPRRPRASCVSTTILYSAFFSLSKFLTFVKMSPEKKVSQQELCHLRKLEKIRVLRSFQKYTGDPTIYLRLGTLELQSTNSIPCPVGLKAG